MIFNILIVILSLAAFVYVALPLSKKGKRFVETLGSQKSKAIHDLLWQREQILATMAELDYEFNINKLSESDYTEIIRDYQSQLRQLDEKIDGLLKRKDVVAGLEKDILRQRELIKKQQVNQT